MENNRVKAEQQITVIELIKKFWDQRKFILKVTAVFAIVGLIVAIFSSKVYTSTVTMVPQLNENINKSGGLAGLAAIAGINLNDMGGNDELPPSVYPIIMQNVLFQKDLMQTKVKFDNISQPISLLDYFGSEEYQSFNLFSFLKKCTVGLPGMIIKAVKGDVKQTSDTARFSLPKLSQKESDVSKILAENISLMVNQKEGTIKLIANMPEAVASAQVVEAARLLLQKYITEYKIDKVQQNLDFITDRYNEAKHNFEVKQQQLAEFHDANHNVILAINRAMEERLNSEYSLSFTLYSELAKQLEQARIKVKQTQPVLTVIEPAVVPLLKSKPKRPMILIGFIVFGLFTSSIYLSVKAFFSSDEDSISNVEIGSLRK